MNTREGMRPWAATPDAHGAKVVPSYMRLPLPTLNAERARLEHAGLRATVEDGVLYVGHGGTPARDEPALHAREDVDEVMHARLRRWRVPGGWLYVTTTPGGATSAFVPDPR